MSITFSGEIHIEGINYQYTAVGKEEADAKKIKKAVTQILADFAKLGVKAKTIKYRGDGTISYTNKSGDRKTYTITNASVMQSLKSAEKITIDVETLGYPDLIQQVDGQIEKIQLRKKELREEAKELIKEAESTFKLRNLIDHEMKPLANIEIEDVSFKTDGWTEESKMYYNEIDDKEKDLKKLKGYYTKLEGLDRQQKDLKKELKNLKRGAGPIAAAEHVFKFNQLKRKIAATEIEMGKMGKPELRQKVQLEIKRLEQAIGAAKRRPQEGLLPLLEQQLQQVIEESSQK